MEKTENVQLKIFYLEWSTPAEKEPPSCRHLDCLPTGFPPFANRSLEPAKKQTLQPVTAKSPFAGPNYGAPIRAKTSVVRNYFRQKKTVISRPRQRLHRRRGFSACRFGFLSKPVQKGRCLPNRPDNLPEADCSKNLPVCGFLLQGN